MKNLFNVVSFNFVFFISVCLFGFGVGGLFIVVVGVGWVMVINVFCFIGFIIILLFIRVDCFYVFLFLVEKVWVCDGVWYVKCCFDFVILLVIGFMMGIFGFNFNIFDLVMVI